ncbi:AAA family ATPase [Candidatus Woesearchaeota archaeon]|nr:AAA family ATPase [Candidatus Woesearchaeota archaeon]
MITICITGTPATGKTTLAKVLMKELEYPVLDIKKFIKEKKLAEEYDPIRKCDVVDTEKLNKEIIREIKKVRKQYSPEGIIIDSHLSHYLPEEYVDLCIITKCSLKELSKRLKKRKYSRQKTRENLDAEIFDTCLNEGKEKKHKTFVINTTKGIKKQSISQIKGEINAVESAGRRAE